MPGGGGRGRIRSRDPGTEALGPDRRPPPQPFFNAPPERGYGTTRDRVGSPGGGELREPDAARRPTPPASVRTELERQANTTVPDAEPPPGMEPLNNFFRAVLDRTADTRET